jgi:hypothetical protein
MLRGLSRESKEAALATSSQGNHLCHSGFDERKHRQARDRKDEELPINFDRVCVTNQFFNGQAKENAALNLVSLLDQGHLAGMLDQHKVILLEVEKVRYAEASDV